MRKILIQGLDDDQGPGDIVGAITGEAEIAGELIGNIDIEGSHAVVEIDSNVADLVVEKMDNDRIGGSRVSVRPLESGDLEKLDEVGEYVSRFSRLVEMEREEEMRRHEQEIKNLSGPEREGKGRALLRMRGRDEGEGLGGQLVKFMKANKGQQLPETEIAVGDLVMISRDDPLRDDNPTGTVTEKTNYSITVAFDGKPPGFVYDKGLRVDLYVNDITYQRMQDALQEMEHPDGSEVRLRDPIIGLQELDAVEPAAVEAWNNPELNESQKEAVRHALGAEHVYLVHGPPGTGKTTTIEEVAQQYVKQDTPILVTAASNTAVDNILEFLVDNGADAVRVGHPARVTPALREHTLDKVVEENETYQETQRLREEAFDIKDEQDELTHPSGRWRRGMSDEQIREAAARGESSRGVPAEKLEEMAEWLELQEEADELFERSDELEDRAVEEVLRKADVVCTTNSTAGSELLDGIEFDVVIIDEATQATEPSALIPITRGEKVVMAGDHRQLPPTVKNEEAAEQGLRRSLFERLADREDGDVLSMLRTQYRMHEDIMGFSSRQFYDGELEADESVRTHTLADLEFDPGAVDGHFREVLDPEEPVVFVNTHEIEAPEGQHPGSTSTHNEREAELVVRMAEECLTAGLDEEEIAVISPYDDQVDLIDRELDREDLEVDTVDGFQGREKEVVLISLARSNQQGEIGFLEDIRRLNVALTRAKRKLVVVGDESTITSEQTYRDFIDYVDQHGLHVEL